LGSLAPVSAGLAWILATTTPENVRRAHAFLICFHTAVIAYAGMVAHLRLLRSLGGAAGSAPAAIRTFLAWTAGNLFAGAQIGYALRPWAVTPGLPVEFVRQHPLEGNFYLAMWASARHLAGGNAWLAGAALALITFAAVRWLQITMRRELQTSFPPAIEPNPNPQHP